MIDEHHGWNKSIKPIILGFISSLILVFAVYQIVFHSHLTGWHLTASVISLGCLQALIQVVFFLHVGLESRPRWNLGMFVLTVFLVAFIIIGSIWIMDNINTNLMINMPKS